MAEYQPKTDENEPESDYGETFPVIHDLSLYPLMYGQMCSLSTCSNRGHRSCGRCKMKFYCSEEHAKDHEREHLTKCKYTQRLKATYEAKDSTLQNALDYMCNLFTLNSFHAMLAAYTLFYDIKPLVINDDAYHFTFLTIIPPLALRMGMDEQFLAFMVDYIDNRDDYRSSKKTFKLLSEYPLQNPYRIVTEYPFLVAEMLMKIRLYRNLDLEQQAHEAEKKSKEEGDDDLSPYISCREYPRFEDGTLKETITFPYNVDMKIRKYLPENKPRTYKDRNKLIKELILHIEQIYLIIRVDQPGFFKRILKVAKVYPKSDIIGHLFQLHDSNNKIYQPEAWASAWAETPYALLVIKYLEESYEYLTLTKSGNADAAVFKKKHKHGTTCMAGMTPFLYGFE